jgi:hypothetical protein
MNLLTKFRNGSLSFCLQLYKFDDSTVVSWNIWNACMNFVLRSTQLQTECGCSRESQFRTGPSQVMMKDLASATPSPPAEFTADPYLMRNCLEFPNHCILGEILFELRWPWCGLQAYGKWWLRIHELWNSVTREEIFFGVLLFGPESWCGESCHNELFSCSFISSISHWILSICSFAWLSFSSFSEVFLFACSWFANLSFSFCSCCIFCCSSSSSLSTVSSPSSSFSWASCCVYCY